jgi:DNA-binding transcriptional ArsR family regulator
MEPIGYQNNDLHLDATFAALADPTRRAILARLASGVASVAELAAPFDMSQPAISKHLRVLERAGLISRGRDAQRRPRRLEAKPLAQASAWLERYREFWEERFQQLDALLVQMQNDEAQTKTRPHKKTAAPSQPTSSRPGSNRAASSRSGETK